MLPRSWALPTFGDPQIALTLGPILLSADIDPSDAFIRHAFVCEHEDLGLPADSADEEILEPGSVVPGPEAPAHRSERIAYCLHALTATVTLPFRQPCSGSYLLPSPEPKCPSTMFRGSC